MSEKPCPSCGYCPTCGRQNTSPYIQWWTQSPSWPYRWTWITTGGGSQTISSGGTPPTSSSGCSH